MALEFDDEATVVAVKKEKKAVKEVKDDTVKKTSIKTHTSCVSLVNEKGKSIYDFCSDCGGIIKSVDADDYEMREQKVAEVHLYIPAESLKAIGRTVFGLLAWTSYLTKMGFPCDLLSVKPCKWVVNKEDKNATGADRLAYFTWYVNNSIKVPLITEDSYYVVSIPLSKYKERLKHPFVTTTMIRYFYSSGFCNIVDYTFMFKAMYPNIERFKCLMMAHSCMDNSHHVDSDTTNAYGKYGAYQGMVKLTNNFKFISFKTFIERLDTHIAAGVGYFVNEAATWPAADNRDVWSLFNEGKFDELYKLALKDE